MVIVGWWIPQIVDSMCESQVAFSDRCRPSNLMGQSLPIDQLQYRRVEESSIQSTMVMENSRRVVQPLRFSSSICM